MVIDDDDEDDDDDESDDDDDDEDDYDVFKESEGSCSGEEVYEDNDYLMKD